MRKLSMMLAGAALFAAATPAVSQAQGKDIVAVAVENGNFKTLAQALTVAGLVETLQGPGPYTVFAPTDEAFAKVPKAQLDALLADKEALKQVLLYHVVPGKVMAADAVKLDGKSAKMVSGKEAKISVMGSTVMINQAHITATDIAASNGVIHVIDAVILPPM